MSIIDRLKKKRERKKKKKTPEFYAYRKKEPQIFLQSGKDTKENFYLISGQNLSTI